MRSAARASAADHADRTRLRAFQAGRLARTYADLLASPRYGPAAEFFLAELYGAKDRAERDETISRVVPVLSRMLPAGAVRALAVAVRLEALSEELDHALVGALRAEGGLEALDAARYARAWKRCANRPARERQLALIVEAGQVLDRLTKMTAVGIALRLMRGPAHAAGFGDVQDFLEGGFKAFATWATRRSSWKPSARARPRSPSGCSPAGRSKMRQRRPRKSRKIRSLCRNSSP